MKRLSLYCLLLSLSLYLPAASPLSGIWENADRFIEFADSADSGKGTMRVVLKPYYRYVYENIGTYPFSLLSGKDTGKNSTAGVYTAQIRYPYTKQEYSISLLQLDTLLFSSFYMRENYTHEKAQIKNDESVQTAPFEAAGATQSGTADASYKQLHGFWIEQGQRYGIFLYPQDTPAFFDAFFFTEHRYIKFRYWKDDLEYRPQYAAFQVNGQAIRIPKLIRRGNEIYSCITSNGSILRNYETGSWELTEEQALSYITLTKDGGGPGSHAVGDTYPHQSYPNFNRIPVHYDAESGAFALGQPFLVRSSIQDLNEEIKKHNSLRRPVREPHLQADTLDFRWQRIKELREKQ